MAERDVPTILGDESAGATRLVRVDPDGSVTVVAEGVRFPNGMALIDEVGPSFSPRRCGCS